MIPRLDAKSWAILALAVLLLAAILLTPSLRENLSAWLVWLAGVLGGGAREFERRQEEGPVRDEPRTSDYERLPVEGGGGSRPSEDGVDDDYWEDLADE